MQEFLTNNTVSWNLMSLTGYRTLVILNALIESPKSNDEINECLFNDQYIKERFSGDTLRIYINSLRKIGCNITKANKSNNNKYTLISHPFEYDIPKTQLKALGKLYKNFYSKMEIKDLAIIENFIQKLCDKISNETTKKQLQNILVLQKTDQNILNDLLIHCKNKNQITFLYNSPKSGEKEIEIEADKIGFSSNKLYLWGKNLTHKEYSYFLIDRITKIKKIKFKKTEEEIPEITATYEIYDTNYKPEEGEKVVETQDGKLTIEANVKNVFAFTQKILSQADNCKILAPLELKNALLEKLKMMEESYDNI